MKMVRAEGAIGWINSGDLLCARNGSGVKRDRHLYLEKAIGVSQHLLTGEAV
jgi:hypothetical protein